MMTDNPIASGLVELRQAAENEVTHLNTVLTNASKRPLTGFEKELVRTAFKGGAVWGADHVSNLLPKIKESDNDKEG